MPMISSMTAAIPPEPPGRLGSVNPRAIAAPDGWLTRNNGMRSSDPTHNATAIRSNRRKLPVAAAARITPAASSTAISLGTPRYPAAMVIPMNSVTRVSALRMIRSATMSVAQDRPNRSMISRACPTPVTAPRRSTISWFTYSTGMSSSRVHSSRVP